MSTLTVRNLDAETKEGLKALSAEHGRSMEAEARLILAAAVRRHRGDPAQGLGSRIRSRFGGIEWEPGARPNDEARAANLDG